jgi:acetamidase/formamidase
MLDRSSEIRTLKALPENIHFGFYSADLSPVLTVRSGEAVRIETTRAEAIDGLEESIRSEMAALVERKRKEALGPHVLTGPVYVEGAMPGDVLEVHIDEIALRTRYGVNKSTPGGILSRDYPASFEKRFFCIDVEKKTARNILPGVTLPLRPFFGNLGVAPPGRYGRVDSTRPGIHCGNLDIKDLTEGTVLYMPVHVTGALFSCGDGHACQADGEADGTALETPLTGVFRFVIRHDLRLKRPMAETPSHYMTIACHKNLRTAARQAVSDMISFLARTKNFSEEDAYVLVSLSGEMHISQLVNLTSGIHFMVPKQIFNRN